MSRGKDYLNQLRQERDDAARAAADMDFIRRERSVHDFRYDETQDKYWDVTTGILLVGRAVDGAVPKAQWPTVTDNKGKIKPVRPSIAINDVASGLTVETSTWWPGKGTFIYNHVAVAEGLLSEPGAVCYNTYRPPRRPSIEGDVTLWTDHVKRLYPEPSEHEHFFDYAAHMVQHPETKANHGIVLAGKQGIGKDTMMKPIRSAVGEHNCAEVDPDAVNSDYNGYTKSIMLVFNEVVPHHEEFRASSFYNKIKVLLAAPPDMTCMNLKYHNSIYIKNLCRVFLTTNDPLAMYIPPEDRRLFVMTSPLPDPKLVSVFDESYFGQLHAWLDGPGTAHVVHWLESRDLSAFDPGEPPAMTEGKQLVIGSAADVRRAPIDDVLDAFIEEFGELNVIFSKDLSDFIAHSDLFDDMEAARKSVHAKSLHFKMDERNFDAVRNHEAPEWRNGKFRARVAFVKKTNESNDKQALVRAALTKRPLAFNTKF